LTTLDKITKTLITLEVAGNQVLFIVLDEDGSINRKGDGSPDCKDNDLFIGITKDKLFDQLRPLVSKEMEEFLDKTYDIPDKKGRPCDFKILFGGPGIETGVQFLYGEFSQGIPTPFRNFTIKAVELQKNGFKHKSKWLLMPKKVIRKMNRSHGGNFGRPNLMAHNIRIANSGA
jgi:hypothetical protein